MDAHLMFIDADGHLYRGFGREWPILVWEADQARWSQCDLPTPQHWDWGQLVTTREAERCYPGASKAPLPEGVAGVLKGLDGREMSRYRPELFDDYDSGISPRRSPDEIAEQKGEQHARVVRLVAELRARRGE